MFIKPTEILRIKTQKGNFELSPEEYFILEGDKQNRPLVINKEGTQKIEDFFECNSKIKDIMQIWNNNNNFNIIVIVEVTDGELTVEGIGSANSMNLSNQIALSYPTEMAVKRAKATAALEFLRKNNIGEKLPLLYSSFDEFKTENINNRNITKEQKKVEQPKQIVENENSISSPDISSSLGEFQVKTNKYRKGITLEELTKKDLDYFKWLATDAKEFKGRYQEYNAKAVAYAKEKNIAL